MSAAFAPKQRPAEGRRLRNGRSRLFMLVTIAAGLVALAVTVRETWKVFPVTGPDFEAVRNAALALRHGESIYRNPAFVYSPTAAVALLPFSFGDYATSHHIWLILSSAALAGAVIAALAASRVRCWALLAAVAITLLMKSDVFLDNVGGSNISLPLSLLAVLCSSPSKMSDGRPGVRCLPRRC